MIAFELTAGERAALEEERMLASREEWRRARWEEQHPGPDIWADSKACYLDDSCLDEWIYERFGVTAEDYGDLEQDELLEIVKEAHGAEAVAATIDEAGECIRYLTNIPYWD